MATFSSERADIGEYYKTFLFPWGDDYKPLYLGDSDEIWAKAYMVIPNEKSDTLIQHQYDDVSCKQAFFRGELIKFSWPIAQRLSLLMSTSDFSLDDINEFLTRVGLSYRCTNILGQGLIKLDNGCFILTEGND